MYIWMYRDKSSFDQKQFEKATGKFEEFLQLSGITPQWAEYHLSCLNIQAANTSTGEVAAKYTSEARRYLAQSLQHLIRSQNEKSVIQEKLMKCRLRNSGICQLPHGPEPSICPELESLAASDDKITKLVDGL